MGTAGWPMLDPPVAGYGVAGVPAADDVLLITGLLFTLRILINTSVCYIFLQINVNVLYILVKPPCTCFVCLGYLRSSAALLQGW
jgi:hypothetical protein